MYIAIKAEADGAAVFGFGVTPEGAVLALVKVNPLLSKNEYFDVIEAIAGDSLFYTDEETPGLMRYAINKDGKCVRVQEEYILDVINYRKSPS